VRPETEDFLQHARALDQLPTDLPRFLSRAYQFKSVADYEIGPLAAITATQASDSIATAIRFIETVAELVAAPQSSTE
jgi:hypothetical protein